MHNSIFCGRKVGLLQIAVITKCGDRKVHTTLDKVLPDQLMNVFTELILKLGHWMAWVASSCTPVSLT